MATFELNGSGLGNALQQMLVASDIVPGDTPSYQLCKTIYAYHPLGAKIAEKPISLAQSKPRVIAVPKAPEMAKEEFERVWKECGASASIFQLMALSRVYGVASLALLIEGQSSDKPVDLKALAKKKFSFNVFDPLNTAGSLVINQQPNSMDFMKTDGTIRVQGQTYHLSRTVVMMNEQPLYIQYTNSGFGFVGRSVYQRVLFPLKSFVLTMNTDDLVALKAGLLVMKLKSPGSLVDRAMQILFGVKREALKQARTYNVLSVGHEDDVTSLNFQNLDGPATMARKNILENIAAGADDMPAQLLNQESFAEGFSDGAEDSEMVTHYVNRIREKMDPAYAFMDRCVQHAAWTPEFYARVQNVHDEFKSVPYETAFMEWCQSFTAEWPTFMEEEPSEQVQVEDVKLKATIAVAEILLPIADPENKALIVDWVCDSFNELKLMFSSPLVIDSEALAAYEPEPTGLEEPEPGKPFAAADSALVELNDAVQKYVALRQRKRLRVVDGRK